MRTRGASQWAGLCAILLCGSGALARPAVDAQIDTLLRQGYDTPDVAVAGLRQLRQGAGSAAVRREALLATGLVLAQSGREAEAADVTDELQRLASEQGDAHAAAVAPLVAATLAHNAARLDVAASLAQDALDALRRLCAPSLEGLAGAPDCEARATWQALQLLQQHAFRTGDWAAATGHARAARDLAAAAPDDMRLALSTADLAWLSARSEGVDAAMPLLHQAQRLARRSDDALLLARVRLAEARIASQRGDHHGVRRLAEQAMSYAALTGSPRLEAAVLTFLSDAHAKLGQPGEALRAAQLALPIVRRHADRHAELALTNNAGLAKIGLKRSAEGLADLARVEDLAQAAKLGALHAEALREYDEALAAAGDPRGALALYHRERALSGEAMRQNTEAALQQLRQRNDHARQQRDIELLSRDNQLQAAALANRQLLHRVSAVAVLVLVLAAVIGVLLYRRVRATHSQLVSSQARLRVQSQRDPLTNLANRRHFLSVMQDERTLGGAAQGFEGAMLLVDIDHFKHVNDSHGHSAGDIVLCEVARRLSEAVRGDDLVVRWGGEEFLVLALKVPAEHAEALAERVLRLVAEQPVLVQGKAVQVTVSIGYARFPLPPKVLPVAWEQAINLADMALYTAKSQGRNRAVGITAAQADAAPELRGIEADFDRAWHEGRVTLKVHAGPMALA